ncbi:MAG: hypothetical protein ACW98F_11905 [Candidatus Hodarchaeales archaeon]|jgi:hypothetical protein
MSPDDEINSKFKSVIDKARRDIKAKKLKDASEQLKLASFSFSQSDEQKPPDGVLSKEERYEEVSLEEEVYEGVSEEVEKYENELRWSIHLDGMIDHLRLDFHEDSINEDNIKFRKSFDFFSLVTGEKNQVEIIIQEEKVDIKPREVRYLEETIDIKEAYLILFLRTLKILIRTPIFYIILINLILRLPRTPHAMGDDAFIVIWMAKAFQQGGTIFWNITPFSLFGFYPFSTYPVGGPAILASIMVFFSDEMSILIFSMVFAGVSIISSYYLAKLIFNEDQLSIFFFVIFFTTSPIFLRFTHWTASMRGPFLSLVPLLLYTTFRLKNDVNWKNFGFFCLSVLLIGSMHQLTAIFCAIFFLSVIISIAVIRLDILNQKYSFCYLVLYFGAFAVGILLLPIDTSKTSEFILSNNSIIGIVWNLSIDYFLRIGLIFPLAILGFLVQFEKILRRKYPFSSSQEYASEFSSDFTIFPTSQVKEISEQFTDKTEEVLYLTTFLVFGIFLVFVSPISKYTSLFVLPWFAFYSVIGVRFLLNWRTNYLNYIIGCLPFIFGLFYSFFVVFLPIYVIGAFILAIFSVSNFIYERTNIIMHSYEYIKIILFLSIVIISLISTDGLTHQLSAPYEFPFSYMSDDELQISNYLKEFNHENDVIVVFNPTVARRIQAMTFQRVLFPLNQPAVVYYGFISSEEVRNHTQINIMSLFDSATPFQYTGVDPEKVLRNSYLGLDLNTTIGIEQAHSLDLRYVVIENTTKPLWRSQWGTNEVLLFTSVSSVGNLLLETQYLRLYEIPTI